MDRKALFAVVASVILLNLSQAPYTGTFLRWFALVPLIYLLSSEEVSFKKKVLYSYITGFLFLLWQYSFFWDILPLSWLGIENGVLGVLFVLLIWVFIAGVLALPFLALALSRFSLVAFPFLWVFVEYARSFLYSVIVLGSASTLGDHFSYGFLGYSAHTSATLLSFSSHLGVYGLSFLIAFVNLLLFYVIQKTITEKNVRFVLLGSVLVITFVAVEIIPFSYFSQDKNTESVEVVAIQGDNPPALGYTESYFRNAAGEYRQHITDALSQYPETDIVVLPESSQFIRTISLAWQITPLEAAQRVLGEDKERVLVYGDFDAASNTTLISSISNTRDDVVSIEKNLLMPLGEYQPYLVTVPARLFGADSWVEKLAFFREGARGDAEVANKVIEGAHGRLGVVSCSEILSSSVYEQIAKENPDLVFHLQRLALFHDNTRVFRHILAVSQLRAAQLERPIVGALDGGGYVYVIDRTGELLLLGDEDTSFIHAKL